MVLSPSFSPLSLFPFSLLAFEDFFLHLVKEETKCTSWDNWGIFALFPELAKKPEVFYLHTDAQTQAGSSNLL